MANIFSSSPNQNTTQTAGPLPIQPSGVILPLPKRTFPKGIIFGVIGFLVIIILFLVFRTIFTKVKSREGNTIIWWGLWEDESTIAPLVEEYQKRNPKIKISYVKQSPQDYRERLTSSFAKSSGPDIFRFHNTWVPMFKNELDYLPSSVISAGDYAKSFYTIASSDLTSGSGLVGIPLEYDGLSLFINEDMFSANGKTPPITWNDLRKTAIELTRKDDQGIITQAGIALGRTENVDHWPEILGVMMLQNGVSLSKPSGKLAEDALTFFTVFSSVDGVWDASLPPSTQAFAAGKLAMYIAPSWRAFEIKQQNPSLKFKTVPLPQLPKETPNQPDVSYATYWAEGVWKRSKHTGAAWDFLKFISSKESLEKLYQNSTKTRLFGEPYPRVDMAELLISDPVLGAIVSQAKDAQTWFLQSRTFDGPTGINSLINKYFEDAVNAVNSGTSAKNALEPVTAGVSQVLSQYGLIK